MNTITMLLAVLEDKTLLLNLIFKFMCGLFIAHISIRYILKKVSDAIMIPPKKSQSDRIRAEYVLRLIERIAYGLPAIRFQGVNDMEKFVNLHQLAQEFADAEINFDAIQEHFPDYHPLVLSLHHGLRRDATGINRGQHGDHISESTIFIPAGKGLKMLPVSELLQMRDGSDLYRQKEYFEAEDFAGKFIVEVDDTLTAFVSLRSHRPLGW